MKQKLYLAIVLLLVILSSCTTTRDNYNPAIHDKEACRELVKVAKCMKIYSSSDFIDKRYRTFVQEDIEGLFSDKYLQEEFVVRGGEVAKNIKRQYDLHRYRSENVNILTSFKLKSLAERYFYNLCQSNLIPKSKEVIDCDGDPFCVEFKKHLDLIFEQVNMPSIEPFAELINDESQECQVWGIGKEDPVKITVWFNQNQERLGMSLSHSK